MPIASHVIEGRPGGPRVLVLAGVHGDEYEPMAAVRRLAVSLDPTRLRGRLTLVPMVNEPAFRRASRTAEDGLDLARTCPGCPDGSVTERLAAEVSGLIRDADALIDLHTGGTRYTLAPLAGYMLHPDRQVLNTQRRLARAFGFPLVWGTDPTPEGRTLSVARDAGIPAIYTEQGGGGAFDPSGVAPLVEGCQNVLAELGMLDRARPDTRSTWVVEDSRSGSGYLQGCHPAPAAGFFERRLGLNSGSEVRAGDLLGHVWDGLGREAVPVTAEVSGLLIGLHTMAPVKAGDGLAIVVELNRE